MVYVFPIIRNYIEISSLGMATFIQGDYGAVQTKGGNILQFGEYKKIDGKDVFKRLAVEEFAVAAHTERTQHQNKNGLWFVDESALPAYSVEDIYYGLESHPNILVRTQTINEDGEKTILSRDESLAQLKAIG